jgi:hypothetical protein
MLLIEHCPESWKNAKTIMLPKPCPETEKDKPENWRPITLTSILYRVIMKQVSNFLQSKHNFKEIVHPCQKGFKKDIEGSAEHAASLNYLIAHAAGKKKSIFIVTLDCRDAYGSVSHKLLEKNLQNNQVPSQLTNMLLDSYK